MIYRCPTCQGLLEVAHDFDALRTKSPDDWKQLFDSRFRRSAHPYGSGVWGKKEWVYPTVSNDNIVSLGEGTTHLFHNERLDREAGVRELWIKQCGVSHSGSFKDLGMTVLVSAVRQMRALGKPIRAVACASTGDTSASLAAYCAAAGIPSVVILPRDKVTVAQLVQPMANAALVLSLDTDFDGCMRVVQALSEDPSVYLANSLNSLRIEGQKTLSVEIAQQLDWQLPDWVVVPGGNLGNVSAIERGFEMLKTLGLADRLPRIAVAQTEAANPLYQAFVKGFDHYQPMTARPTLASAIRIGDPVSIERAIRALKAAHGVVGQATEDELADAAARVDRFGTFNCPHTGVALAVLFNLVSKGTIGANDRVVVVSTAHGLKFAEFKVGYHEDRLNEVKARYTNRPIELPADAGAVREHIERWTQH